MMDLKGKVVLIVNYNDSQLGKALCVELLKRDCKLCITKDPSHGSKAKSNLNEYPNIYKEYQVRTENYDEVVKLKSTIEEEVGSVDILIMLPMNVPDMSVLEACNSDFSTYVTNCIKSYIWPVKCFSTEMLDKTEASVVGVVPMYVKSSAANMLRRALTGFLKSLRSEFLFFHKSNVSVTIVQDYTSSYIQNASVSVDYTEMSKKVIAGFREKSRVIDVAREDKKSAKPTGLQLILPIISVIFWTIVSTMKGILTNIISVKNKKDITNQVVLVTGGGMGLGREIALKLAKTGCRIAIADIDYENAKKTVEMLRNVNAEAMAYHADISSVTDLLQLKLDIERDLGNVDILINNAALIPVGTLFQAKVETIEKTLDVNMVSHMMTLKLFLPNMIKSKRGHIVAISSIAGFFPLPAGITYTLTKFGITGFMDSLEHELAQTGLHFIKTTSAHPYFMRTRKDLIETFKDDWISHTIPWLHPGQVARKVVDALLENNRRVWIPNLKWVLLIHTLLPYSVDDFIMSKLLKNVVDLACEGNMLK